MALDQDAADAGKLAVELRHRGFVGNDGTVKLVEQRGAGNLHVHGTGEAEIEVRRVLRPQRQHGVKSGGTGKEQCRGGKARQIFAGVDRGTKRRVVQVSRGIERQQNRNRACCDFRQDFCDRRIQSCQHVRRRSGAVAVGFQRLEIGERGAHRAPVDVGRRQARALHLVGRGVLRHGGRSDDKTDETAGLQCFAHDSRNLARYSCAACAVSPPRSFSMSKVRLLAKLSTSKPLGSSWPLRMSASMAAWNAGTSQCPARTLAMV